MTQLLSPIQKQVVESIVKIIIDAKHKPIYPLTESNPHILAFVANSSYPFNQMRLDFHVDLSGEVIVYPIRYKTRNHSKLYTHTKNLINALIEMQKESDDELSTSN